MGPDGVRLEHHANVSLVDRHRPALPAREEINLAQRDLAGVGDFQSRDAAKRGGFSTSARPQQGEEFSRFDGKTDSSDGGDFTAVDSVGFPQSFDFKHDQRLGPRSRIIQTNDAATLLVARS
ncbi:MAG TPA: hypothetical protein DEU67_00480, partial [Acidobacteria bacterium]|nr:hypothetical protein [Acidobacteriota bacterium]